MDFNFFMPAKVISGEGCLKANAAMLKSLGTTCGIVTGGSSAKKSGALDDAIKALEQQGIAYSIFDGITPNPQTTECHAASVQFRQAGVDFILGIGGGSPLDSAKAVAAYTVNPELEADDIFAMKFINKPLPIVLIGTSSGTGSEVSKVSVLTDTTGRKRSIKGDELYASLVFADSTYTSTMPYDVTVSTALDALAHAVEGFVAAACGDIPTMFAYKGIPLLWSNLCKLLANRELPDADARRELYYGSLYAGIVLNACGTLFPHPMGYILTENYGVPHGKACAAFMPALIERSQKYAPERVALLMKMLDTDVESFCNTVRELTALPDISMTEAEVMKHCERWVKAPNNFICTPGGFTHADSAELMKALFLK